MNDPILLKKYKNRRLYDCTHSTYVTLADVEEMLQRGLDIRAIDSKTGEDITRSVLIQIILEGDDSRDVLPPNFLKLVVRFGNSPMKEVFSKALLNYLNVILQSQNAMASQFMEGTPNFFQAASLLNPFALFTPPSRPSAPSVSMGGPTNQRSQSMNWSDPMAPNDQATELDSIKSELAKTQELVRQLLDNQEAAAKKTKSSPKKKKRRTTKKTPAKTTRKMKKT